MRGVLRDDFRLYRVSPTLGWSSELSGDHHKPPRMLAFRSHTPLVVATLLRAGPRSAALGTRRQRALELAAQEADAMRNRMKLFDAIRSLLRKTHAVTACDA